MSDTNLWRDDAHARAYLQRADGIPRRQEGESALLEALPRATRRVLDLGSGNGRLLGLVLDGVPEATGVALDFSGEMLRQLHARFDGDPRVEVVAHDLAAPLPDLGMFDAVVSCFAIHHVIDTRKATLYREVYERLTPGGVFLNLEHVASPTSSLHLWFLAALGVAPEDDDPSNKLAPVDVQLGWLREVGFADVDCHWKWRELALLAGRKAS